MPKISTWSMAPVPGTLQSAIAAFTPSASLHLRISQRHGDPISGKWRMDDNVLVVRAVHHQIRIQRQILSGNSREERVERPCLKKDGGNGENNPAGRRQKPVSVKTKLPPGERNARGRNPTAKLFKPTLHLPCGSAAIWTVTSAPDKPARRSGVSVVMVASTMARSTLEKVEGAERRLRSTSGLTRVTVPAISPRQASLLMIGSRARFDSRRVRHVQLGLDQHRLGFANLHEPLSGGAFSRICDDLKDLAVDR